MSVLEVFFFGYPQSFSLVYAEYFASGHGSVLLPLLLLSGIFMQGANVMAGYWLVWWQEIKFQQPQGFYMGIYAGLGVAQAIGFFLLGAILSFITYFGSQALHRVSSFLSLLCKANSPAPL